jgi:hypothetical protein
MSGARSAVGHSCKPRSARWRGLDFRRKATIAAVILHRCRTPAAHFLATWPRLKKFSDSPTAIARRPWRWRDLERRRSCFAFALPERGDHAIELYLNALLLRAGHPPSLIRGLRHDFSARADLAITCGLLFRRRTAAHLRMIAATREHLVTRYGPELTSTLTQLNRLAATLDEIATKVHFAMSKAASTASPRIECAGPGSEPRANKVTKSCPTKIDNSFQNP